MIDLITLFKVCLTNIDMTIDMYDLSPSELYKLKKLKGDLEVYLLEKDINNN